MGFTKLVSYKSHDDSRSINSNNNNKNELKNILKKEIVNTYFIENLENEFKKLNSELKSLV